MPTLNKLIKFCLCATPFLPLLFTPFTFFPWHYGKTAIFQIIVELLLLCFIIFYRSAHKSAGQNPPSQGGEGGVGRSFSLLDWSLLIFTALLVLTAFTGVNAHNSFWGNQARANGIFTWLHFFAFYILLINFFQEEKDWKRFFYLTVGVAFLTGITALFPQLLPAVAQSVAGGGIIGNRAFFSSYMVLSAGISLILFASAARKVKWLWLFLSVFFVGCVISAGNRGAEVGIFFGVLAGLFIALLFVKEKKVRLSAAVGIIILAALVAGGFYMNKISWVADNFPRAAGFFPGLIEYSSGTGETRLMAWKIAWQGLKDKPILGWGMGNYEVVFNKYFNPRFLKYSFTETVWDKPHNWLLDIANSAGIIGALAYLTIIASAGWMLLKVARANPQQRAVAFVACSVLVAYFIQNLFLFETTNSLLLWMGLLAYSSYLYRSARPVGHAPDSRPRSGWWKIAAVGVLLFAFCASAAPLRASYYTRRAETSYNLQDWLSYADKAMSAGGLFAGENAIFLAEKFTKFDKANAIINDKKVEEIGNRIIAVLSNEENEHPDFLSFPVWAGQVYLVLGEKTDAKYYVEAEKKLARAQAIAPAKQEALFLLGRLYLLEKKFDKAIEAQKAAVALEPSIDVSHWFLGLSYVAAGRVAEGLAEIEKAARLGYNLTVDRKLYLAGLYAGVKRYDQAIGIYQKLLEEQPENVDWQVKLAAAYALAGQKKEARDWAERAARLYPPLKPEVEKFIKQYNL